MASLLEEKTREIESYPPLVMLQIYVYYDGILGNAPPSTDPESGLKNDTRLMLDTCTYYT